MSKSNGPSRARHDVVSRASTLFATFLTTLVLSSAAVFWPQTLSVPEGSLLAPALHYSSLIQSTPVSHHALMTSKTDGSTSKSLNLLSLIGMNDKRTSLFQLNNYDRVLYTRIFEAQEKGDWEQANAMMKRLQDPLLMGHILYDRYIRSLEYKASYKELRDWMEHYGDHPNAYRVYQLAQKRRNNDAAILPSPKPVNKLFGSLELSWFTKSKPAPKAVERPERDEAKVKQHVKEFKSLMKAGEINKAHAYLTNSKQSENLTALEYDTMLSDIAARHYYRGNHKKALRIATTAIQSSASAVPIAQWIAGLVSWQDKKYEAAATYFEAISQSHSKNPWMLSAGAFWAARSYQKLNQSEKSRAWLQEASTHPRTFYGFVAKAKLGQEDPFSWAAPKLTKNLVVALQGTGSGKRALALLDIGKKVQAEQELLQSHPQGNRILEKALVAIAYQYKFTELAMRLGNTVNQPDGKLYDVALYPIVPWKGDTSTRVDPALINALIRQESRFDPNASNARSGARGLMQLMPRTAEFVSDVSFNAKDIQDPEVNVALGQRYVNYLLKMPHIKGNLLYLAAAYNAGPGNLKRWQKKIDYQDDPFLFIESIPLSETRGFVERVMTNYWIYNQRLKQETTTLEALSKNKWPVYQSKDDMFKLASY